MEWLMIKTMLIVFPQTFNLLIRKLCCMCLKSTKQWSRWSLKEGVPQWDMFPDPSELRWIGCLTESIWTPKSKSSTLTPKTNWQWRKSHSKLKGDDEFGLEMPCKGSDRACLDCIWKPGEHQIWKSESTSELVKCAVNRYGDPLLLLAHQTPQNGTMMTSVLLKCGNLVKCRKRARRNLYLTIWSSILIWTLPPPQNRTFL